MKRKTTTFIDNYKEFQVVAHKQMHQHYNILESIKETHKQCVQNIFSKSFMSYLLARHD
jgi:hypothetical protein